MKRSFILLIGVSTILLLVLLTIINTLSSKTPPTDRTSDLELVPTTSYSKTTQTNRRSALQSSDTAQIDSIMTSLPLGYNGAVIDYSEVNDLYYMQDSATDEAALDRLLDTYKLRDLFNRHPEMFRKISKNPTDTVLAEMDTVMTSLEGDELDDKEQTTFESDQQQQIVVLGGLLRSFLNYSNPTPTQSPATQPSTGSGDVQINPFQPISPIPGVAQIGSFKASVKWDWENNVRLCKPQPGTLAIVAYIQRKFGSSASYGIGIDCKTGTGKVYAHLEGRAVDYAFHASNAEELRRGNEAFAWLLTNAQNIGIQYAKFWRLHWSARGGLHCVDNTISRDDMYNHSNHIHFELNREAAKKNTPFFTRNQSQEATVVISQEICPLLDPRFRP